MNCCLALSSLGTISRLHDVPKASAQTIVLSKYLERTAVMPWSRRKRKLTTREEKLLARKLKIKHVDHEESHL